MGVYVFYFAPNLKFLILINQATYKLLVIFTNQRWLNSRTPLFNAREYLGILTLIHL